MCKLTKEQSMIVDWLKEGHTFDVCSEYCPNAGVIVLSYPLTTRITKKAIHKLIREGFIKYQSVQKYGVRWDRFSIALKGRVSKCTQV
ncbi:hypothetical protein L4D00_14440 [Photobacterium swingsii]|uniref:hypothetical protein n=1 Tax=Photobacterium swingsii TaxID=680026 RepID=UPI003D149DF8